MRTHTVELFDITELSDEAQEKAVDKLREIDYFSIDTDTFQDMFTEKLEEYGFPTDNIEWSLSWCQGDGVAFYGAIDIKRMVRKLRRYTEWVHFIDLYELSAVIKRNSYGNHYSHWNTMDVYMERGVEYTSGYTANSGKILWELIKETVVTVSRECERMGYKEIEYRQAKEQIIELAEANEMEFREDGRLWHG